MTRPPSTVPNPGPLWPPPRTATARPDGSREFQRGRDVGGGSAARDHRRPLVDHGVVQRPRLVVSGVVGQDHLRAQPGADFVGCGCEAHGPHLLVCSRCDAATLRAGEPRVMTTTEHFRGIATIVRSDYRPAKPGAVTLFRMAQWVPPPASGRTDRSSPRSAGGSRRGTRGVRAGLAAGRAAATARRCSSAVNPEPVRRAWPPRWPERWPTTASRCWSAVRPPTRTSRTRRSPRRWIGC